MEGYKDLMIYQITDSDDIYLFFESVERAKADAILDIGAFLIRIGAISRSVKDKSIPPETIIDALKPDSVPMFPVYQVIYNKIFESLPGKKYEFAIMLRPNEVFDSGVIRDIIDWSRSHVGFLLTDMETYNLNRTLETNKSSSILSSEKNQYVLISF